MKKTLILPLLFIFYSVLIFTAHAVEIKFGINSNNSAPLLYQSENPNLATGGFIYEMIVALADKMNLEYSVVALPKKRMTKELRSGNIDLTCYSSLHWDFDYKDEFSWSKPIFLFANVLVSLKDIPFKNAQQITGITLGTVENYSYRDLNASFQNQKNLRQNATSVSESVKKLLAKRLDYIIMSEIEFYYYKKNYPELKRSSFRLDKTDVQCALNKKSYLTLSKLNKTIDQLKEKKVFDQIFNRYIHSRTRPKVLVYGLNESHSPPFIFSDSSTKPVTINGGIFFDLALEVGRKLKRPLHFVALPRNRLDASLTEGPVELICYNAEAWAGEYAKDHLWSIPFLKQSNVIVSNRIISANEKIKSLKDLKGKTIGTTLGFVYPALESYFKDGSIIREDGVSGSVNISKLSALRVPYVIMNNLEYDYYKKKIPDLVRAPFEFDSIAVKCALSKKSDLKIEELNTALLELKKSGKLNKIFFGRLKYML